jgi:hypothetical protein
VTVYAAEAAGSSECAVLVIVAYFSSTLTCTSLPSTIEAFTETLTPVPDCSESNALIAASTCAFALNSSSATTAST